MTPLHQVKIGQGDRVIFAHGDGPTPGGDEPWTGQLGLADEFELTFLDRNGFGNSPPAEHGDYIADGKDIADLLGGGAHLVGHSGGAIACLLAACECPEAVKSLTIIEPPLVSVVRGEPVVEALVERYRRVYETANQGTPPEFWAEFIGAFGFDKPTGLEFSALQLKSLRACMTMQPIFCEVTIPLERLAAANFPKFILSGDWNNVPATVRSSTGVVMIRVCDEIHKRIGGQRFIFEGASHSPQWETQPLFNVKLRAFLKSV